MRNVEWATATCVLGFGVFGKFWNEECPTEYWSSEKQPWLVIFIARWWLPQLGSLTLTVWMVLSGKGRAK